MSKGADVPTISLLRFIEDVNTRRARELGGERKYDERGCWPMGLCCVWDFPDGAFGVPWKVLAAKISKLIRRGYLDGCDCGCRGDWQLTNKGREKIQ